MKIAISGASGYIGKNLVDELGKSNHELIILGRNNLYHVPELIERISGSDVVVHLAGAPILQRWTKNGKAEILNSRTITTQNITQAINQLPENERPKLFISASAVGIYDARNSHTETSNIYAEDFVGEVVRKWEESSSELTLSVRKVIFRIGLVLGKEAKTMKQLLPVFKFGLGGRIGSGQQPFPFIHIQDVARAVIWAVDHAESHGTYNLVAPQNINNLQFTAALAQTLHRPAIFSVPGFALKVIFGEASTLLLESPSVSPERLIQEGFRFEFPDIQACFSEILS